MVFIETRIFTRQLSALGKDAAAVLDCIQTDLLNSPERGRMVQGLGGVRKARAADPGRGKGKRGGLRYLYLSFVSQQQIHLLYLFGKNEREDLDAEQRKLLRDLAAESKTQEE